jgi:hypothetical protein
VDIDIEQTIHVHFENIFFVSEGNQIQIESNSIATFYHCKFSNGSIGCDEFPKCTGDKGCIHPPKCKLSVKKAEYYPLGNHGTGESGYPGIAASNGGNNDRFRPIFQFSTPNTFLSISLNSISTDIPNASRSNSNTVKLIFNYETVHCFDGAPVASLDSHLSHVTYSAIVHLNQGSVSV